ncbi:hypothetical protein NA56DRAFT_31121 [Hyaloscypha hepaticicola]|uniref:Uncharacterized protein n=1 Tax=Hyaloscypha hepaticicola TaxID=2082293 RepID=A0A2J6QD73_9HELO|nr:hypothetical protein NA56DRAFT_31121 [Hyaloscypha hepaticicola]
MERDESNPTKSGKTKSKTSHRNTIRQSNDSSTSNRIPAHARLVQCQRIFPEQSQQAPNLVSFLTVRCGPAVRSRSRTLLCPGRCAPISRAHITTLLQGMKSKVYSKSLKGSGKGSLVLIGRLVLNVCGSFLTRFPTHKAGGSSSRSQAELQRCTEE